MREQGEDSMDKRMRARTVVGAISLVLLVGAPLSLARAGGGPGATASAGVKKQLKQLKARVNDLSAKVNDLTAQLGQVQQGVSADQGQPRPPTGPAGGELTGSYPNPSVGTVSGLDLAQSTSPSAGINFGGDTSLWRDAANVLRTDDFIDCQASTCGVRMVDNAVGNTRLTPGGLVVQPLGGIGGAVHLEEASSVGNPFSNTARIYATDSSGATQLVVVWPGGNSTQLAVDPTP
jgi:hypothetical protein